MEENKWNEESVTINGKKYSSIRVDEQRSPEFINSYFDEMGVMGYYRQTILPDHQNCDYVFEPDIHITFKSISCIDESPYLHPGIGDMYADPSYRILDYELHDLIDNFNCDERKFEVNIKPILGKNGFGKTSLPIEYNKCCLPVPEKFTSIEMQEKTKFKCSNKRNLIKRKNMTYPEPKKHGRR